jgi:EpsD family peptidyl-prolyl cis-trans isomerase
MNRSALLRAAAVAAAVAAGACAREESPPSGGVAARVKGGELPARRNEREMLRERHDARADLHEAAARALECAIDQELLVQTAIEAGLDRDPEVMRALDEGRRRVLSNAWLDRALADRTRPSESEVRAFYAANPALFAERRIYALREIRFSGSGAALQAVATAIHAGSAAEVQAAIAHSGLQARTQDSTQPAEALPLALLAKLQSMKDGETTVVDSAGGLGVVELLRAIPAPLAESEAAPTIERFLASRKRDELAHGEVARLRDAARIEYIGEPAPAQRPRAPREASPAVPVNASIQATLDTRAPRGLAVTAVSEKDEQS